MFFTYKVPPADNLRLMLIVSKLCFNSDYLLQLFDTIFSFLARKTDFYSAESVDTEKIVLQSLKKHETIANAEKAKKKEEKARMEQKRKEKLEREAAARSAPSGNGIQEVTDEEAAKIQMEIDRAKKAKEEPQAGPSTEKLVDVDGEEEVSLIFSSG